MTSCLGGLHTAPALVTHDGRQSGIQLALSPLGARVLLGMPAAELASIDVEAADVLGRLAAESGSGYWPRPTGPAGSRCLRSSSPAACAPCGHAPARRQGRRLGTPGTCCSGRGARSASLTWPRRRGGLPGTSGSSSGPRPACHRRPGRGSSGSTWRCGACCGSRPSAAGSCSPSSPPSAATTTRHHLGPRVPRPGGLPAERAARGRAPNVQAVLHGNWE